MNPRTGERRIPGRADQPMPDVYARQGYERVELDTAQKLRRFENSTGLVHEQGSFDINTGSAERSLLTGTEAPRISGLDDGRR